MVRIDKAIAVLGLGLAVFGATTLPAGATLPSVITEAQALRKQPPDGPGKPPKPKRTPNLDHPQSPIASADIG